MQVVVSAEVGGELVCGFIRACDFFEHALNGSSGEQENGFEGKAGFAGNLDAPLHLFVEGLFVTDDLLLRIGSDFHRRKKSQALAGCPSLLVDIIAGVGVFLQQPFFLEAVQRLHRVVTQGSMEEGTRVALKPRFQG